MRRFTPALLSPSPPLSLSVSLSLSACFLFISVCLYVCLPFHLSSCSYRYAVCWRARSMCVCVCVRRLCLPCVRACVRGRVGGATTRGKRLPAFGGETRSTVDHHCWFRLVTAAGADVGGVSAVLVLVLVPGCGLSWRPGWCFVPLSGRSEHTRCPLVLITCESTCCHLSAEPCCHLPACVGAAFRRPAAAPALSARVRVGCLSVL